MTIRAAIYVRISRDSEESGLGVARQEQDCRRLAAEKGWEVVAVITDNDVSASSYRRREGYETLLARVRAGEVDAIVVWDVDRLTRQPRELEDVIDFAETHGLQLASVGGEIDLATAQGRMVARIKGSVARHEAESLGRRVRAKHIELARAGAHSGRRPFGWDIDPATRRLVVNQDEAGVVREVARRLLEGETLRGITSDLNDRGVTTPFGNDWETQTLRRLMLRWNNVGIRSHQPIKRGKDGKQVPAGPLELHPAQWEPILERDVFDRVVALLSDPARRKNRGETQPKYLLSSLALCGGCGGHVVGTTQYTYTLKSGRQRTYPASYKCPHRGCHAVTRRMTDVDQFVSAVVVGLLERDGVELLGGDPCALAAADGEVAAIRARLDLAADQFADGAITAEQLGRISTRLQGELDVAERRRAAARPVGSGGAEWLLGPDVRQAWEVATALERKAVIRHLGLRITLMPLGTGRGSTPVDETNVRIERPA